MKLANTLKIHRKRLGLTQAELAEKVDVSRKSINTIENGVFTPSTFLALKLARAMSTSIHDIFTLEDSA